MRDERFCMEGKWNALKVLVLIVLPMVCYMVVKGLKLQDGTRGIQAAMALLLAVCMIYMLFLKITKRLNASRAVRLVFIMGCVMRIGYMLYTPVDVRGHDLFELDVKAYGKAGYLLRLVLEGRLPESNTLQLYQQPFFYIAGAAASRVINTLLGCTDMFSLVDAAKTVSCAASCLTLAVVERLFGACGISEKGTLTGMVLAAFTPVCYLTAGRVSEDAVITLFMTAALLYTLYWEKTPDWRNTVILALLYGFGMMTKISMAVPALYTAWVFAKKVYGDRKNRGLYGKLVVFGCISLPLGLWYSLRNMVKFHQGITYVLMQDTQGPVYRGKVSLMQRFLIPDVGNMLDTPYANALQDHNLFVYLLKSELFGEFTYQLPEWIPYWLLLASLVLTLTAAGYCLWILLHFKSSRAALAPAVWMVMFAGFAVKSYLSYPFACTMDFRYYIILTVCKAILIGRLSDRAALGKVSDEAILLQGIVKKAVICFWAASCVMYCMI